VRNAPSTLKHLSSSPKEIALQFTLPAFTLPDIRKIRFRQFSKKQLWIGSVAAVMLLLVATYISSAPSKKNDGATAKAGGGTTTKVLNTKIEKPGYDTLLPLGKSIESLKGWRRVSPPEKEPVFAYADTLDSVPITVSEQPLPDSFAKDIPGSVSKLAEQSNAKETVTVDDTTAYIGTSEKGPQSVIFVKDKLLVLIKSTSKLSNDQWAAYIATLRKG